ncbi:MAG: hypothetical protein AB7G75_37740 [Candidatus Binatia bacterium]
MKGKQLGGVALGGFLAVVSISCTVKQQQDALAGVGMLIPGSRNSLLIPESPNLSSQPSANNTSQTTVALSQTPPAPRNDLGPTDAQWVLQTMQRAMKDNPTPFIECLDNSPCRSALTTHLIRLQKLAGGTLELPPVYERYDLQRGKE